LKTGLWCPSLDKKENEMLLRLVMPYIDRRIQGGTILKWHKNEGEWIHHGDDLFDFRVEEVAVLSRPTIPKQIIRNLNTAWTFRTRQHRAGVRQVISIISSDMGIMRRIYAKEGTQCEVGDFLAVLTTEEEEAFEEASQVVKEAILFRVVANTSF
jgi:hypothetical protein